MDGLNTTIVLTRALQYAGRLFIGHVLPKAIGHCAKRRVVARATTLGG